MNDFSDWTPIKQEIIRGIFPWQMKVCKAIMDRNPRTYPMYHYIDMNAADGQGSPAIFLDTARAIGLPYRALFIESSRKTFKILEQNIGYQPGIQVQHADHNHVMPAYCRSVRGKPFGLIYHDPCGIPSFETLATISALPQMRYMDILINCPATAIKKVRGSLGRDQFLIDELARIKKDCWLVRQPPSGIKGARWQWTILLGTNWADIKDWRRQRMFRDDSPEGQAILERLNYSAGERCNRDQGTLPFL